MNSPHSPASLTDGLGARIRTRRRIINHTLAQTATAAGLSPSFLSQVERDLTTPSVRSLRRIAHALNMPIQYFVDHAEASICRVPQHQYFRLGGLPWSFAHLTAPVPNGQLQSILVRVPAGAAPLTLATPAIEETLYVAAGELTLMLDGEPFILHAGDSAYYRSNQAHHWANPGDLETLVVWTGSPRLI
ncbi:helix-turn-helix domain-containing protein [Burkholderia gladioli]|uniref:helix-turn-helix domain-containing protein n=1 Tax=Burkholderia gladioli TaxID=28095 RepID=UPI00163E1ACD|nr:XRE family transcriptional regulator [Burkholderia gladioli]